VRIKFVGLKISFEVKVLLSGVIYFSKLPFFMKDYLES
jgi:hypothetical protein